MFNTNKKYSVIYADPAWQYNDKSTGGSYKSGAGQQYPVMELSDIMQMPVKSLAADNCALLMWWVPSQPLEALKVVEAWGFKIKTMKAFTWVKQTSKGNEHFGLGHYTRGNTEDCLIAVRGRPARLDNAVRQLVTAKIGAHSEKPVEVRNRIERLYGDVPRIELFARHSNEGWDTWGNQVGKLDIKGAA